MAASLWWDDESSTTGKGQNDQKDKHEDILVFGYACKLFRDDEKAKAIDAGKRLIPWMGDESLMIDRYDGRGHLFDLTAHDADHVSKRPVNMSEHEAAVEKACDEERYLELHTDMQEVAMYEEEEWKRYYLALQEGYQAVGFSYDQPQGDTISQEQQAAGDNVEEEKPFIVPEELQVPPDMEVPQSQKEHARIEKTANFISKQGIQMEIMIKTKQSGNSQFDYLHFENRLNPFYKHVVQMMKSGRYKYNPEQEENSITDDKDDSNYLHPSLSSTTLLPPPPPAPSKPIELPKVSIHDTPYGALIQSIKRNSKSEKEKIPEGVTMSVPSALEQTFSTAVIKEDMPIQSETVDSNTLFNGISLVERLYGPEPEDPKERPVRKKKRGRRRSSSSESSSSSSSSSDRSSRKSKRKSSPQVSRAEGPLAIVPPPPDVQPIVDRMALYVAKNGLEFEIVVKGRNDSRFQFLNQYHVLFPYYSMKRELFIKELGKDLEQPSKDTKSQKEEDSTHEGPRSVSFSIKSKPKESEPATPGKPSLFENDSSGDEEQEDQNGSANVSRSATPPVRLQGNDENVKQSVEEKLKDKLSSALKERISHSTKERNIQAERKKKAAMFLTMLKSNQSDAPLLPSNLPATLSLEDSSSLYVGESSSPLVYDYTSKRTSHRKGRSRSPRERHRKRKSPIPPSAYSLDKRPPLHPGPPRWGDWSTRERDRQKLSKSPVRKDDRKKKKHKRSRSRSPLKTERSKGSKHKSKDKDRDKDRKKKKEDKKRFGRRDGSSDSSDLDVIEHMSKRLSKDKSSLDSKNGSHAVSQISIDRESNNSIPDKRLQIVEENSIQSTLSNSPSRSSTHETKESTPQPPSMPSTQENKDIPPLPPSSTPSASNSDFMSKVRAMLKKSREMIHKEDTFTLEDT